MSVATLTTETTQILNGARPGGPVGQKSPEVALGTILSNLITLANANEAGLVSNPGASLTINSAAVAGTNSDPFLRLVGGDGGAELIHARFDLDSSADKVGFSIGGGAAGTTRKNAIFSIGFIGEDTADVDAILEMSSATSGGANKTSSLAYRAQENLWEIGELTNDPGYTMLGTGVFTAPDGGTKTPILDEKVAGDGVVLPSGVEVVGVPKTVKVAIAYSDTDAPLLTVPSGETWLITDVWFQTLVSWDGNNLFTIGVTADADGFLTCANANLVTTNDESGGATGWPTGSIGLDHTNRGPLLSVPTSGYKRSFRAVATTAIDLDATIDTSTQGNGELFITYIRLP